MYRLIAFVVSGQLVTISVQAYSSGIFHQQKESVRDGQKREKSCNQKVTHAPTEVIQKGRHDHRNDSSRKSSRGIQQAHHQSFFGGEPIVDQQNRQKHSDRHHEQTEEDASQIKLP
ncbi:hypothetical protein SDC9_83578 [bioreactor metagenome]|uniref:Uncharacterized protein n=1 Tax=bioreactor metagenome TaxID=1076179 RepID=A0A644ZGK1_9ZZZZ